MKSLVLALALASSFVATVAYATCDPANPANPENDCDLDGCKVGAGDCNDSPDGGALQKSAGCPGGALPEVCDGVDNNCSGTADEGDPGGGAGCSTGLLGVCAAGINHCTSGAIHCAQTTMSSAEICDGLDNNCNGSTDESLTRLCYAGPAGSFTGNQCPPAGNAIGNCVPTGACAGVMQACSGGAFPTCDGATAGQTFPTTETCNNVDDNCNGTKDEGNPGGGGMCSTGLLGVCAAGTNTCTAGSIVCHQNVLSSAETCNNLDDNCNGSIDDGVTQKCFDGVAGTFGGACPGPTCAPKGICKSGTQTCAAGVFGACTGETLPDAGPPGSPEPAGKCNGLDDDCDGTVDDGNPGGGMVCTVGGKQGVCANGTQQCTGGALVCTGPNATTEICDGLDNDCDGLTDEQPDGGPVMTRTCYVGAAGSFTGVCPPPGTTAQGTCSPRGTCSGALQTCGGAAGFPACTVAPPGEVMPVAESCDGLDNDCNGAVDNGNPGGGGACAVTGGVGYCAMGTLTCTAAMVTCVGNMARAETCNGIDDNCNGQIDEGFDNDGDGFKSCAFCATMPCDCNDNNNTIYPGAPELCDCVDQDCDGKPWNGFPDQDGDGVPACAGAAIECNDLPASMGALQHGAFCTAGAVVDVCDALDNDCNGTVDKTASGASLSRSCYDGPAGTVGIGTCHAGTQTCNATVPGVSSYGACANEVVPSNTPSAPETMCNGLDDDCDGVPDDGFDMDNDGFVSCALCPTVTPCDCNDADPTIKPGATELCDNIDQNCNGQVNDVPARKCFTGNNVTPVTYSGTCPGPTCTPKGVCTAGIQACDLTGMWGVCLLADAGSITTPANMPSGDEAVCNGKDDDCDGVVDDGPFDQDMDGVSICQGDCNDNPDGGFAIHPANSDAGILASLEVCDGLDNNCDGIVDGTNTPCYDGPPGTAGVGICHAGTGLCVDGGIPLGATCNGEQTPLSEGTTCDGLDNDCDGKVDEDFDQDHDGVVSCLLCPSITPCDCNDSVDGGQFIKPGAAEVCDCQDNNCNGTADEGMVCFGAPCHDFDFDGITNCQGDCDDHDPLIGPNQPERPHNNRDDDCDGQVDEDTDEDGDGYSVNQGDCNDKVAAVHPGAIEVCDGFDNNCDGKIDEGFDKDGDFATTCVGDCDDNDPTVSPYKTEICGNNKDDNCDGRVDEDLDDDGDGVTTCQGDCNDHNAAVHGAAGAIAAATEICDGQDNDCNGLFDEGFDKDGDGVASCLGDCDDNDPNVNPNVPEQPTPNGGTPKDENCNGLIDEGSADNDHDGFTGFCGDCNDSDPNINPHATEVCDRVDNNCDGYIDSEPGNFNLCAACFDNDNDGQTNCDGDCDDNDKTIYRGAPEICDGKLNNCGASVGIDLDENGFNVCRDAGFSSDAGSDGGVDDGGNGVGGGNDMMMPDGGHMRPVVQNDCGCGSAGWAGPMAALALLLLSRRRNREGLAVRIDKKRREPPPSERRSISVAWPEGKKRDEAPAPARRSRLVVFLAALLPWFFACQSSLTYPLPGVPDAGEVVDAGVDAGMVILPDDWACPGFYPTLQDAILVPNTTNPFAISPRFARTEVDAANAWVFDNATTNVAALVLARALPTDVDPNDPTALSVVAVREVQGLDVLQGTPLVSGRVERVSRTYSGNDMTRTVSYSTSQNIDFPAATNAFAVRNRLLATLSGQSLGVLGALPEPAGAMADAHMVVNLMFTFQDGHLFISATVTPLSLIDANQPVMLDLTNGSHLGAVNATINYRCEHRVAPALKSDFIFVVDDSGSMAVEQAELANASAALYDAFTTAGLDFRLGVVSTDSDVLFGGGFTTDLPTFQNDVRVGINGNSIEMGLEYGLRAVRRAKDMSQPPERRLRDDAGLVVVILSDEENTGLESAAQYGQDYIAEKAVVFAIVGPKPIGCVRVGLARANAGTQYIDVATATGGSSGSICNPNLLEIVEEVVLGSLGAASKSPLAQRPISNSLAVQTGHVLDRSRLMGFDYEPGGNTILFFGTVPPQGTPFDVAYSYFTTIM